MRLMGHSDGHLRDYNIVGDTDSRRPVAHVFGRGKTLKLSSTGL